MVDSAQEKGQGILYLINVMIYNLPLLSLGKVQIMLRAHCSKEPALFTGIKELGNVANLAIFS